MSGSVRAWTLWLWITRCPSIPSIHQALGKGPDPTSSCFITEFWNWINDGVACVGLHGDFNMTGSYEEWEQPRRLIEAWRTQAVRLRRPARHRAARGVVVHFD